MPQTFAAEWIRAGKVLYTVTYQYTQLLLANRLFSIILSACNSYRRSTQNLVTYSRSISNRHIIKHYLRFWYYSVNSCTCSCTTGHYEIHDKLQFHILLNIFMNCVTFSYIPKLMWIIKYDDEKIFW